MRNRAIFQSFFVFSALFVAACGSDENSAQQQVLITEFEVKKASLARCKEVIKNETGINAYAPSSEKMIGTQSITLTWEDHEKGFKNATCVFELYKGIKSLTIDGRKVVDRK